MPKTKAGREFAEVEGTDWMLMRHDELLRRINKIEKEASNGMIEDQPAPQPSSGDVWLQVIKDMEDRRLVGIRRYGTPLQPFNGRDALVDLYQELLDAVVYIRQLITERDTPNAVV